jgi:ABC-type transport system substrate-binding protein
MPGYDENAPHYVFDLEKSAAEFKLADLDHDGIAAGDETDGTDVWNMGFRIQMLYNQGNTTRQIVAEILSANLSAVNEKFLVEILGLPWPSYLAAQRAGQIPVMTAGWQEDIHDPHNWYQPYTTGSYGGRQNMPADIRAQFKALLDEGVAGATPAARAEVYYKFNQLYYDLVPGLPIVLSTSHGFEQKWVTGRVMNPLFSNQYFYPMSKTEAAKDPTTFVYESIGDIDTLDPALAYDTSSGEIIQNVYETLIFYKGESTSEFVPQLATEVPTVENGGISADGKTVVFKIRDGVKFHNGDVMTPSDVAYSLQRGLLQGGTASPQWMFYEAFFGVGVDDISLLVDPEGSLYDDRGLLAAFDAAKLVAACEQVKAAVVADDAAGTVTLNLAQTWGPLMPTLAQTWGSVMSAKWVAENGGWDGSCDTWQNFYAMTSAEDPFTSIAMGTGPFSLTTRTAGQEIVMSANENYWRSAPTYAGGPSGVPALKTVIVKIVPEWGTRFSTLQAGDADIVDVPVESRSQADALVGEKCEWDAAANTYAACTTVDETKPLRLRIGRPGITTMDVIIYNFAIK